MSDNLRITHDGTIYRSDLQRDDDEAQSQYLRGYADAGKWHTAQARSFWPLMFVAWAFGVLVGVTGLFLFLTIGPVSAETVPFRNPVATVAKEVSCANIMLGVQFADAYTTRQIMSRGGYERDPLAKPFVRSDVGAYASAVVFNVAARLITHRHPSIMCYAAAVESVAVANNIRVLGAMR